MENKQTTFFDFHFATMAKINVFLFVIFVYIEKGYRFLPVKDLCRRLMIRTLHSTKLCHENRRLNLTSP